MSKRTVIASKNLPTPPLRFAWYMVIVWLITDKFDTPGWVYGVVFTILGIFFVTSIVMFFQEDSEDIFEIPRSAPGKKSSKFAQKLMKAISKSKEAKESQE